MTDIDVDRVLQLEQEFQNTRQITINQLLDRQKETAEQLKALGYNARPTKGTRSRKPCRKCGATDHDARFHRADSRRGKEGSVAQ